MHSRERSPTALCRNGGTVQTRNSKRPCFLWCWGVQIPPHSPLELIPSRLTFHARRSGSQQPQRIAGWGRALPTTLWMPPWAVCHVLRGGSSLHPGLGACRTFTPRSHPHDHPAKGCQYPHLTARQTESQQDLCLCHHSRAQGGLAALLDLLLLFPAPASSMTACCHFPHLLLRSNAAALRAQTQGTLCVVNLLSEWPTETGQWSQPRRLTAPDPSWCWILLNTWQRCLSALPEKRDSSLDPQRPGDGPLRPSGTIRPNCLVPALKDVALPRGLDPDGGKAFPDLSSVIKGKLIFTKQSPMERVGMRNQGAVPARTWGPSPGFQLRTGLWA